MSTLLTPKQVLTEHQLQTERGALGLYCSNKGYAQDITFHCYLSLKQKAECGSFTRPFGAQLFFYGPE